MASLYYNIDPYAIQIEGLTLTVLLMDDGVYRVQLPDEHIADIYPEITATGIYWNSFGQITPGLAEEIGRQIWACEV